MAPIKRQILITVLGSFALVLLVVMAITYDRALHEVEEIFDAELAQMARLIGKLSLANLDSKGQAIEIPENLGANAHKYEQHVNYQVWYDDVLVLKSVSAPNSPLADKAGFMTTHHAKPNWRVFGLYPENSRYRIYTSLDDTARRELSWEISMESLKVLIWSIPALGILIFFSIQRGLKPLERLSREVSRQQVDQLQPIEPESIPAELKPLIVAFNGLMGRMDAAMLRERQFTSDAAHELRTPLSSIRLFAQLAKRAKDKPAAERELQRILSATDQTAHLVEQLLTLSRLSPENPLPVETEIFDLSKLFQRLQDDLTELCWNHDLEIDFQLPQCGDAMIAGNEDLLYLVCRNLLDNAIRYSPRKSRVICKLERDHQQAIITVMDQGHGIPSDQLTKVTQRFTRLAGQEIPGCGLGLSIATHAIEHLGGTLRLENHSEGEGGLRAVIELGVTSEDSHETTKCL